MGGEKVVYEKKARQTCGKCGRQQFVKKNQVHFLPRASGPLALFFLCKYCGWRQPLDE